MPRISRGFFAAPSALRQAPSGWRCDSVRIAVLLDRNTANDFRNIEQARRLERLQACL
jgi:hypothetical protein